MGILAGGVGSGDDGSDGGGGAAIATACGAGEMAATGSGPAPLEGTVIAFPQILHLAVRPPYSSGTLKVLPHLSQLNEIMMTRAK